MQCIKNIFHWFFPQHIIVEEIIEENLEKGLFIPEEATYAVEFWNFDNIYTKKVN